MPTNVNEGDVIVLYTPKGTRYYQGVIQKISDKKSLADKWLRSLRVHLTNLT